MLSFKLSCSIIFILFIFGVFGNDDFFLYSVTSNPVGQYVTVISTFTNQVLANTTLNLNGLTVHNILNVETESNVLTLLCEDSNNSNYLVLADAKSGEVKKSKGVHNVFNLKNNNNYIFSNVTDDIYLPTFSNDGKLILLHWNFNQESDFAEQLTVDGISDIDSNYQPKGVLIPYGGLYLFYKSNDISNSSRLALLDLNNTNSDSSSSSSSSSSSLQLSILEIYTVGEDFDADGVEMIYTDNEDGGNAIVYAIYNTKSNSSITNACRFVLDQQSSVCYDAYLYITLNPENYNYNPYYITSDLSSFVTLKSTSNQLSFSLWALNFGADTTTQIQNIWQSNNPSNVTYFKN